MASTKTTEETVRIPTHIHHGHGTEGSETNLPSPRRPPLTSPKWPTASTIRPSTRFWKWTTTRIASSARKSYMDFSTRPRAHSRRLRKRCKSRYLRCVCVCLCVIYMNVYLTVNATGKKNNFLNSPNWVTSWKDHRQHWAWARSRKRAKRSNTTVPARMKPVVPSNQMRRSRCRTFRIPWRRWRRITRRSRLLCASSMVKNRFLHERGYEGRLYDTERKKKIGHVCVCVALRYLWATNNQPPLINSRVMDNGGGYAFLLLPFFERVSYWFLFFRFSLFYFYSLIQR